MTDLPNLLLAQGAWLRRLAADLVRPELADDVVQETLRIAIERPPVEAGALRSWLTRVLQNVARRLHRTEARRSRHERARGNEERTAPSPADVLARQQLVVVIAEAVRELDEPYRTTIHLRYYEGMAPSAIAAHTGVNLATVKTRLLRARERLRQTLDRRVPGGRESLVLLALPERTSIAALLAMTTPTKVMLVAAVAALACLPFVLHATAAATSNVAPPPSGIAVPVASTVPAPRESPTTSLESSTHEIAERWSVLEAPAAVLEESASSASNAPALGKVVPWASLPKGIVTFEEMVRQGRGVTVRNLLRDRRLNPRDKEVAFEAWATLERELDPITRRIASMVELEADCGGAEAQRVIHANLVEGVALRRVEANGTVTLTFPDDTPAHAWGNSFVTMMTGERGYMLPLKALPETFATVQIRDGLVLDCIGKVVAFLQAHGALSPNEVVAILEYAASRSWTGK